MFLEPPLKAEITTRLQCSLPKPTTLSFSQADTQTLEGAAGCGSLFCSSSFEVFNSSFVTYSSAHISSISVLTQQLKSQRLIFSPVAQGLCPAPGWHGFFYLNSGILRKLNSFSLSPSPSPPIQAKVPTESKWEPVSVYAYVPFFLKCRKCIKERRVQLEPSPLRLCFFPLLPSSPPPLPRQAPAFNFQKHCNCLVWFQELGCHSPWWWLCWRQWHSYHA